MKTLYATPHLKTPRDPGAAPIVPAKWQDLGLNAKLFYYASAINSDSNMRVFTVHFTTPTRLSIERDICEAKRIISQRMRDYLPSVPWLFILEMSSKGVLHIHGMINPLLNDDQSIETALKKVAGDYKKISTCKDRHFFRRYSVNYGPTDWSASFCGCSGPYGWCRYIAKDTKRTKRLMGLNLNLLSVNHHASKSARELHREDCDAMRTYKSS